jgi:hypothetical protein
MEIFIQAVESGKFVRVYDRIQKTDVYDGFLEMAVGAVLIQVASYNDLEGNIDIIKGGQTPPNTYSKTDYDVKAGEVIKISDGQD